MVADFSFIAIFLVNWRFQDSVSMVAGRLLFLIAQFQFAWHNLWHAFNIQLASDFGPSFGVRFVDFMVSQTIGIALTLSR